MEKTDPKLRRGSGGLLYAYSTEHARGGLANGRRPELCVSTTSYAGAKIARRLEDRSSLGGSGGVAVYGPTVVSVTPQCCCLWEGLAKHQCPQRQYHFLLFFSLTMRLLNDAISHEKISMVLLVDAFTATIRYGTTRRRVRLTGMFAPGEKATHRARRRSLGAEGPLLPGGSFAKFSCMG